MTTATVSYQVKSLSGYYCSQCKRPAVVTDKGAVASCNCGKPIVAEMASNMAGKGGVNA